MAHRDAARKLTQTYISARQEHLDKVKAKALPKTFESITQPAQMKEEAAAALEKSLVGALGEENGKKAATALGGGPSAFDFLRDHAAADILAAGQKALAPYFKLEETVNKVENEARAAGSFDEGMGEKLDTVRKEVFSTLSGIFSQEQMNAWKGKYPRFFEPHEHP
ncbi:MAG: hypothetical protein Q8Q12_16965 [bacterium]|nr:hypothetical protein [bacterium]